MADLNKIIDELSKLTVVEAAELSKQLEEKWGVTAAAPVAAAAPGGAAPAGEEKSEFSFLTEETGSIKGKHKENSHTLNFPLDLLCLGRILLLLR